MKSNDENRKDKAVAWGVTIVAMGLMLALLLACSLKTQIPPPPPKKMVYIDIAPTGGGGGGGTPDAAPRAKTPSGRNVATQNAQDAPSVNHSDRVSPTQSTQPATTPRPDQSSMYRGRGRSGSGGGSGSGIGSGTGSGLGPGEGGGSGGGVGYGTGHRGLAQPINTTINEQGQICVEVHVAADGHVIDARVINNAKHKTTITDRNAQQQCVARAKQAKYHPGKEELRIIIFS